MNFYNINKAWFILPIIFALSVSSITYAEDGRVDHSVKPSKPFDGELLLPDDYDRVEKKKCMTVCDRWGKDCTINPSTGNRKCRRVCKSFTKECFK